MGPGNPWSPSWRPDESGSRRIVIQAARRGALLAGLLYLPICVLAPMPAEMPSQIGIAVAVSGLPGVALLGAGLAPSTLGSRIDAVVTGIAFGIGSPVAAVTSLVIAALVIGSATSTAGLAGDVLRAGITAALGIAPLVAIGAAIWVVAVRRLGRGKR
jgi:hypothetical protein